MQKSFFVQSNIFLSLFNALGWYDSMQYGLYQCMFLFCIERMYHINM